MKLSALYLCGLGLIGLSTFSSQAYADCSSYCDSCGQKNSRYPSCDQCNSCRDRESKKTEKGNSGAGEKRDPPEKSRSDRKGTAGRAE